MNNLKGLIKINFLSSFPFLNKFKKKFKSILALGVLLYSFIFIIVTMYLLAFAKMFSEANKTEIILYMGISLTSILILISNITKVNTYLFSCKDYELLTSMPISEKEIIVSKLVTLYALNYLFSSIILFPCYIAYAIYTSFDIILLLSSIILSFALPIIPMVISSFIALVFKLFQGKNFNKIIKTFEIIFGLLLVISIVLLYTKVFVSENDINKQIEEMGKLFLNIWPMSKFIFKGFYEKNTIYFLIYILLSFSLSFVYVIITSHFFNYLNNLSLFCKKIKNRISFKKSSEIKALTKKELRLYLSTPSYVINTIPGPILTIITIILLCSHLVKNNFAIGYPKIDRYLDGSSICGILTILMMFLLSVTSTSSSSISLEGKSLWVIKSVPVSVKNIFLSKIILNLLLIGIPYIISFVYMAIAIKPHIYVLGLTFLSGLNLIVSFSVLGLVYNLFLPKFEFTNSIQVIKQGAAVLVNMLISFAICLFLFIVYVILVTLFNLFITLITITIISIGILVISIILLSKKGREKYNNL